MQRVRQAVTTIDESPMPPLSIEAINRGELLSVYRLEQQCFPQPWPYTAFEHHLDAPAFLVAKANGRVIAYVVGDLVDGFPGPVGHIKDLAVDPDHRRRGIASMLLSRALFLLEEEGAVRAELEVRQNNDGARTLYDAFGFSKRGIRPGYYADGEDAIVMNRPF